MTHHGLDAMARRMITELKLLVLDANADIYATCPRFQYIFMVGSRDLYEGVQSSAELYISYCITQ